MPAYLNIGNTWDLELLEGIEKMKEFYTNGVFIDTLFGSTSANLFGNARSPDRVQDLSMEKTKEFIIAAHKQGLKIAWTMNVSCVGNIHEYIENFKHDEIYYRDFFQYLDIDYLIVANPLIMILLSEMKIEIPIEVSTITNVTEPNQLTHLVDIGCNIKRFCVPVGKNRDIDYLESLVTVCSTLGIEIEVMANEFCFLDACNCEGIFRRTCYDTNAHAVNGDEKHWTNYFPRNFCMNARESDPVNWLRAKWILPQHMTYYEDIGINRFKLTGRTHPTRFILGLIPYYLKREYQGNLLNLWAHLQTIGSTDFVKQQNIITNELYLDTQLLDKFFDIVFRNCTSDCSTCSICEQYYTENTVE